MSRPTVGSLFAGIGGIDLGLEWAGFETAWFCEQDEYCQKILARHWPGVPCFPDVRGIDENAARVDVLAGGFPCQPVSTAGRRLAQDDPRWLWPEFARLIRLLRPRGVLLENVPGLLTAGFGNVLGDLAESGYDAEWDCIPAAAAGAPHRRDRVFIIATPRPVADAALMLSNGSDHYASQCPQPSAVSKSRNRSWPAPMADANSAGSQGRGPGWTTANRAGQSGIWPAEPAVGRVANGIPNRVDRLRALGNAVVPQVAEIVGRRLREVISD